MREIFALLAALLVTLAVELPLGGVWWRKWDAVGGVALVNMLTNPLINLQMTAVAAAAGGRTPLYWVVLGLSEAVVVAVECVLLQKMLGCTRKSALRFSLAANFASFFIGLLMDAAGIL